MSHSRALSFTRQYLNHFSEGPLAANRGRERWQKNIWATEGLSTSIVHDIRNPLATVYAVSETLVDLDPAGASSEAARSQYLPCSRTHAGPADRSHQRPPRRRATAEICDIRDVIAAACAAAGTGTENSRVLIVLEMPDRIELPLVRRRMERVFFNLITNALEAMPSGGQLSIGAWQTGNVALIKVEDTGPGIADDIRERLFEPFVTAGKPDGLGLGLALSRATVLDHGGDIWSEPAAGARFIIRLPLNGGGSHNV